MKTRWLVLLISAFVVSLSLLALGGARAAPARVAGITVRVSVASDGTQANASSHLPSISDDGRYVAFYSAATNLVISDTNSAEDIFVHDRQTGQTVRVSVASDGTQGNNISSHPSISGDGRYVAFASYANNLTTGDTNNNWDIFVYDRETHETTLISRHSNGIQGDNVSDWPSITADGRYVAFASGAGNLIGSDLDSDGQCEESEGCDTNSASDVFVRDRYTDQTARVSIASSGAQGNLGSSWPSISADGRYVTFNSGATNLVSGDTNDNADIFVHDRYTGQTTRVSIATDGTQGNDRPEIYNLAPVSTNGRVAFASYASNLVISDTNDTADVFVHDCQTGQTTRISVAPDGAEGTSVSSEPSITADGRYVAFMSAAGNLVAGDTNNRREIFVRDLQTNTTTRAALTYQGQQFYYGIDTRYPAISANGLHVAFESDSNELVPDDTCCTDVFVREGSDEPAPTPTITPTPTSTPTLTPQANASKVADPASPAGVYAGQSISYTLDLNFLDEEPAGISIRDSYPWPGVSYVAGSLSWGPYIAGCQHNAETHSIACNGQFPASAAVLSTYASFDVSVNCAIYDTSDPAIVNPASISIGRSYFSPSAQTQEKVPFRLRASTPAFLPQAVFTPTHTVLLYTVPKGDEPDALLQGCAFDAYVVVNGDVAHPLLMTNNGGGRNNAANADFNANDVHHSTWFVPTQATTYTLDLYIVSAGKGFGNAMLADTLLLPPNAAPQLAVLTDLRELLREFDEIAAGASTQDANANKILDYYDAVERIRQYAGEHRGVVVDVRQDGYHDAEADYYASSNARWWMGRDTDELVFKLPRSIQYIAIVGDDAVIPFHRVPALSGTADERRYPNVQVDTSDRHGYEGNNPTLLDILEGDRGQWMSDIPYGTFASEQPDAPRLDVGLGRVFQDRPLELVSLIDALEQPINLIPGQSRTFVTNARNEPDGIPFHDIQEDSTLPPVKAHYGTITRVFMQPRFVPGGYAPGARWLTGEDRLAPMGSQWEGIDLYCKVKGQSDLLTLSGHATHWQMEKGDGVMMTGDLLGNQPGLDMRCNVAPSTYRLVISAGCHAGLNIARRDAMQPLGAITWDAMFSRVIMGVHSAFYATTSYDTGDSYYGDRDYYHDQMRRLFLERLFNPQYATLGDVLKAAHQAYSVGWLTDNNDTKVLYTIILYGLPTQPIQRQAGQTQALSIQPVGGHGDTRLAAVQSAHTITRSVVITHFEALTDSQGQVAFAIPHNGRLDGAAFGPILPVVHHSYILPAAATDITVTLMTSQSHPYGQPVEMTPLIPVDKSLGPVSGTFTVTNPYPETILWYGVYTDAGGLHLHVNLVPLQYDPDTGQVTLYDRIDYQIAYDAPTTYTVQSILVNDGEQIAVDQPSLPITITLDAGQPFSGTLFWEIRDVAGTMLDVGYGTVDVGAGASQVGFSSDTLGWDPGPKQVIVGLSAGGSVTENVTIVASGQQVFTVLGRSIEVEMNSPIYGTGSTSATVRAVVRDQTGAQVPGLAGDFTQKLDGSDLALTWQEGGSYTALLNLTSIVTGQHVLSVTLGRRVGETRFLVDRDPPTSTLSSPAIVYSPAFAVTISGNDLSGVDVYHVQYRVGLTGTWTDWLTRTTRYDYSHTGLDDLEPTFGPAQPVTVTLGTTYYFRVRAVDWAGHWEAEHSTPDTATTYVESKIYLPLVLRKHTP